MLSFFDSKILSAHNFILLINLQSLIEHEPFFISTHFKVFEAFKKLSSLSYLFVLAISQQFFQKTELFKLRVSFLEKFKAVDHRKTRQNIHLRVGSRCSHLTRFSRILIKSHKVVLCPDLHQILMFLVLGVPVVLFKLINELFSQFKRGFQLDLFVK